MKRLLIAFAIVLLVAYVATYLWARHYLPALFAR